MDYLAACIFEVAEIGMSCLKRVCILVLTIHHPLLECVVCNIIKTGNSARVLEQEVAFNPLTAETADTQLPALAFFVIGSGKISEPRSWLIVEVNASSLRVVKAVKKRLDNGHTLRGYASILSRCRWLIELTNAQSAWSTTRT